MKKNFLKYITICFIVCLCAFVFAGCSNNANVDSILSNVQEIEQSLEDLKTAVENKETLTSQDLTDIEQYLNDLKVLITNKDELSKQDLADVEESLKNIELLVTNIKTLTKADLGDIETILGEIRLQFVTKLTLEEGFGLYKKTMAKWMLNSNGVRDNVKITGMEYSSIPGVSDYQTAINEYSFYKDQSGGVYMWFYAYGPNECLCYNNGLGNYMYSNIENEASPTLTETPYDKNLLDVSTRIFTMEYMFAEDEIKNALCEVNALENGNYSLTFVYNEYNWSGDGIITAILKYEISNDEKLQKVEVELAGVTTVEEDKVVINQQGSLVFEYGAANVEYITSLYENAKQLENKE